MTLSKDLFMSILSMDAYNRGYGAGIDPGGDGNGLGGSGQSIGYAQVGDDADDAEGVARSEGFYAISYTLSQSVGEGSDQIAAGTTIISYRGTDEWNQFSELAFIDVATSYFGSWSQPQFALAKKFFDSVNAANGNAPIVLTGHSLGGALAGITAALTGTNSVLVDNIGFNTALENLVQVYNQLKPYLGFADYQSAREQYALDVYGYVWNSTPDQAWIEDAVDTELLFGYNFFQSMGLNGSQDLDFETLNDFLADPAHTEAFYVLGSVAFHTRDGGNPPFSQGIYASGIGDITTYLEGLDQTIMAHSVVLHVLMKYIEQEYGNYGGDLKFLPVFADFLKAYTDQRIALDAGFAEDNENGVYDPSFKLMAAVGYSAIDEGVRVFGDTGIRALFDDLDQVGKHVSLDASFFSKFELEFLDPTEEPDIFRRALIETIVQFAGEMALRKVEEDDGDAGAKAVAGIVQLYRDGVLLAADDTDAPDVMYIDLSAETWDIAKSGDATHSPEMMMDWLSYTVLWEIAPEVIGGENVDPENVSLVDPFDHTLKNLEETGFANLLTDFFAQAYGDGTDRAGWSDDRIVSKHISGVTLLLGGQEPGDYVTELSEQTSSAEGANLVLGSIGVDNVLGMDGDEVYLLRNGRDLAQAEGGNDLIHGGRGADTVLGGEGNDILIGGVEVEENDDPDQPVTDHDDLIGGTGDDLIRGGDGADLLFDGELPVTFDADGNVKGYNLYAPPYDGMRGDAEDGTGSDTLFGGRGSDILVYTGGQDSFEGGAGNDTYYVTAQNYDANDSLTIRLANVEDDPNTSADETATIGHDVLMGDLRWLNHQIVFDGISSTDVTVNYSWEIVGVEETSEDFDWLFNPFSTTFRFTTYSVVGTVEIIIDDESSLTILGVSAGYVVVQSGNLSPTPAMILPNLNLVFDDAAKQLDDFLRQGSYLEELKPSVELSETAFAALESFVAERDVEADTLTGAENAEPVPGSPGPTPSQGLYGGIENEFLDGQGLVQVLSGGDGKDRLKGGEGGQALYGGDGIDTADYSGSDAGIVIRDTGWRQGPTGGPYYLTHLAAGGGHATGDTLKSIENIIGSSFADILGGQSQVAGVLRGEEGNDQLRSAGAHDTLFGGGGHDYLGLHQNGGYADGGDGNDLLVATGGNSTLVGGSGDDTLGSYDFLYLSHGWGDAGLTWSMTTHQAPTIGYGSVTMDGGEGTDTAEFRYTGGVIVDMVAGQAQFSDTEYGARFKNIENIKGGVGNDLIIGDDQDNVLNGNGGDDTLIGGGGNDTIHVGVSGSSVIFGGEGQDTLVLATSSDNVQLSYADGGIRITRMGDPARTVLIAQDVETVQFNDISRTFNDMLAEVQTEFNLIGDVVRLDERQTQSLDVLANDLPYGGNPLHTTHINGSAIVAGQTLRLASGSTITLNPDGTLTFDQAGAYAWLDGGESASESLTYTATDLSGQAKTAPLLIVIDGKSSEPTLINMSTGVFFAAINSTTSSISTIANFNIHGSFIDLDGVLIDPNSPPVGVSVQEVNGDTLVLFGDDGVLLRDISLAAWQFAVQQRTAAGIGNDSIIGTFRTDVMFGGAGNDTINGAVTGQSGGDDVAVGGEGNDRIIFTKGNVVAYGNEGNDSLTSGSGDDVLIGGDGNDVLTAGAGNDLLRGGSGNDVFYGGGGRDTFEGGEGIDTLWLTDETIGADGYGAVVDMDEGTIRWAREDGLEIISGIEQLFGSVGRDTILGSAQGDRIDGREGDDLIDGRGGNDTINGSAGSDTIYGGEGDDSINGYTGEDLIYGGAGNDRIDKTNYTNTVYVGEASLYGGDGDDVFLSFSGVGLIDGGDGNDTLDLSNFLNSSFIVNIDLTAGVAGAVQKQSQLASIEHAIGNDHNNSINGDEIANSLSGRGGHDSISGQAGNDSLFGGSGNDTLDGGDGDDLMAGGTGNDTYRVNSAADVVEELAGEGTDVVETTVDYTLTDNVENLILLAPGLVGTGNNSANRITGSTGNDTLEGLGGNDSLIGGDGDDLLDGGTGNDSMVGGAGNDHYLVDSTSDSVIEAAAGGNDTVSSSVSYTLGTEVENLTLIGIAAINGTGNVLANVIQGNAGANSLNGGDGNDTIFGGDGNDTLTGGLGDDFLAGGLGNDSYNLDAAGDIVSEAADEGTDTVSAAFSYTLGDNIEALVLTGTAAVTGTGNADANTLTGNTGANFLSGLDGNDTISGGNGDDTLDGGTGDDSLIGGSGNDLFIVDSAGDVVVEASSGGTDTVQSSVSFTLTANVEHLVLIGSGDLNGIGHALANSITGTDGANTLSGLDGNDSLFGGAGDDTLDGGTGDDRLDGGTGNDSMAGGTGHDVYIVDALGDTVTEAASSGTDRVESSVSFILGANIENLTLTGSAAIDGSGNTLSNVLIGNEAANSLNGLDGNDSLDGGAGNDTLDGGAGADTLNGGTGNDSMVGGLGNDTYVVDSVGDTVVEAASGGTDLVQSSVSYVLGDNVENLTLSGAAIIDGTGNALNNTLTGNAEANVLLGLLGNDNLYGGAGNDSLEGGDGNDLLDGGTGNDTLVGGLGNDTYVVDSLDDVVVETAGAGTDLVQSSVTFTLDAALENLTLTGSAAINGTGNSNANTMTGTSGANILTADAGNDTVYGGSGNDTLLAGDGDDYLDGGTGNDSMDGGSGNDTFVVDSVGDVLVEGEDGGIDLVRSSVSFVLGANFEHLILTGSSAINGTGNAGANDLTGTSGANILTGLDGDDRLYGGNGNDSLFGGSGNDILDGGSGNDHLEGGDGDDIYLVNAAGDVVIEAESAGTDLVQSSVAFTLGTGLEHLTLTGSSAIAGIGNALDNILTGNTGANSLSGLDGSDTLYGGGGNDTLFGGAGNDFLDGGSGADSMVGGQGDDSYVVDSTSDVISEAVGEGLDSVTSSVSLTLAANVENLALSGTSGLSGTGNALDNILVGNSGANNLSGLDGNDTLVGGGGNDTLTGGLGADHFVFNSTSSGVDIIADFNELNGGGEEGDILRFDGLGIGTFSYLGTDAFTGGSDNSEARVVGNQVLVDTNGDGTADITITLTGLTNGNQLSVDDFLFV